jgi:hypothetical protein
MRAILSRRASAVGAVLVATVLVSAQPLAADEAAARLTEQLTGGAERAWVKTLWQPVLSAEVARCVEGEIWVFAQDGGGTARTCRDGAVVEHPLAWAPAGTRDGLPLIELDGKQYLVDLRQKPAALEGEPPVLVAILRTLRASQIDTVEEIRLEFRRR